MSYLVFVRIVPNFEVSVILNTKFNFSQIDLNQITSLKSKIYFLTHITKNTKTGK